jgi:hypothetical protein
MNASTHVPRHAGHRHTVARRSFGALAAIAVIAVAAPADAQPLERGTFHDVGSEQFLDEEGNPGCEGLDIMYSWDVSGSYLINSRGRDGLVYFSDSVRGTEAWTNLATGKSYTLLFTRTSRDMTVTDNGDGTLTIIVQGSGGDRWYDGDGQLVLRDPGMVRFEILIDHAGTPADPFDDEFVEFVGIVKGSTGLNETDGRDFCEDIALFTT